jgi:hypothetical protein
MENKYNIGDRVYHVTPESEVGIVVDWRYSAYSRVYSYLVTWGIDDTNWYIDVELSDTKIYE